MKFKLLLLLSFFAAIPLCAQDMDKEAQKREKAFYDAVEEEVNRQTLVLSLEDWQVFKLDSTLMHDYKAMQEEMKGMSQAKVSNTDLYQRVQDKWKENIYESYHKFLSTEQWEKYLKKGADREKKARDKRMEKYQD